MIKYRSRLRILLITFLAGVFLTNVYTGVNAYIDAMTTEIPTVKVDELRIKLPVVNSNSPLVVRPQSDRFPHLVGAGGAGGCVKTYGSTRYHCPPFLNITSKPRAQYTDAARNQNVQGTVILRMTFSKDGSIGDIKVIHGLGFGLTEQAIAAAKQIVFHPKQINGVPVSVTKTVEYNFNIY